MTTFQFRLDRVLAWRRTQLELAEIEFRREAGALAELEHASADLEARSIRTEAEVRQWSSLAGSDLLALSGFRLHVGRRAKELAAQRTQQAGKLAEREQAMLEARRRCRLLERLRERRLAEWQAASGRELEQVASESYLARFARQSSIMKE
jgi:hypothetical protein